MSGGGRDGRARDGRPEVGARIELDVGPVAHGGHFVARTGAFVVFVRLALPGERVVAEVTEVRKGHAFAEAVQILQSSPDRVSPRCPAFAPFGCGGCDFQHVGAAAQRSLKADVLREALVRHGRLAPDRVAELTAEGVLDLGRTWGWRSRMRFDTTPDAVPAGLAMHAHRSARLVDASGCVIADPEVLEAARGIAASADGASQVFAAAGDDGVRAVAVPSPSGKFPRVSHRLTLGDEQWQFRVPVDGFWQSHPLITDEILRTVLEFGDPQEGSRWWDLYAGVGPIAAAVGYRTGPDGEVHAVEGDERAVKGARRALHRMPWVRVHHHDVRTWVAAARRTGWEDRSGGVVLDPPRSGAGRAVLADIADVRPPVVVYVACDPVALARDAAILAEHGYRLEALRAWDAFPQTHHLEAAAAFQAGDRIS